MPDSTIENRWLTTREVTALLGVTSETVRRMVRENNISHVLNNRGQMRISRPGMNAYLGGEGEPGDRWLRTGQVAVALGVNRATARRRVLEDKIPHIVLTRSLRVRKSDLDAYLDAQPERRTA